MKINFIQKITLITAAFFIANQAMALTEIAESMLLIGDYTCEKTSVYGNLQKFDAAFKFPAQQIGFGSPLEDFVKSGGASATVTVNGKTTSTKNITDIGLGVGGFNFAKGNPFNPEVEVSLFMRRVIPQDNVPGLAHRRYNKIFLGLRGDLGFKAGGSQPIGAYVCTAKSQPELHVEIAGADQYSCQTTDDPAIKIDFTFTNFDHPWLNRFVVENYDTEHPAYAQKFDSVKILPEKSEARFMAKPYFYGFAKYNGEDIFQMGDMNNRSVLMLFKKDDFKKGKLFTRPVMPSVQHDVVCDIKPL